MLLRAPSIFRSNMRNSLLRTLHRGVRQSQFVQRQVSRTLLTSSSTACNSLLSSANIRLTEPCLRQYSDEASSDDDSNNLVLVEKLEHFHIMTIGINRPDKRNAVNTETAEYLKLAFQDFESDENMYIAVLHGLGDDHDDCIDDCY